MGTNLFVGNLSFEASEQDLHDLFAQGGRNVTRVHIVMDRETGRPRGFGFVEMGTEAEAQSAMEELNGADLLGRALRVNEAQERKPRSGGGGGGGGYGRGGRGGGGGGYGGGGRGGRRY